MTHPINDLGLPATVDPDAMTRSQWAALAQTPQDRETDAGVGADAPRRSQSVSTSAAATLVSSLRFPWAAEARCLGMDPELWFPERGEDSREAKAVCRTCPARPDCLEHALAHEHHGVWGGKTEAERRRIRSERYRAAQGGRAS